MSTIIHALVSLACIAAGSIAGSQLLRRMSEQNRCQNTKDIVKTRPAPLLDALQRMTD